MTKKNNMLDLFNFFYHNDTHFHVHLIRFYHELLDWDIFSFNSSLIYQPTGRLFFGLNLETLFISGIFIFLEYILKIA